MKFICPLLVVSDIKASQEFYENILGQKVKDDFGENIGFEGGFSIHLEEHYRNLLEIEHDQILKKSNNFELYFETEELDDVIRRLKECGIEFIHEIKQQPWGQRVARLYDLDYHIIEIGETMESVVLRYYNEGMSVEEISCKTSLPKEFIEKTINI